MLRPKEAAIGPWRTIPSASVLIELARPRLVTLGLSVVALTYVIAAPNPSASALAWLLLGSALALCGASALNQVLERDTDALMRRTASRPIPRGQLSPSAAAAYGLGLTVAGLTIVGVGFGISTTVVTLVGWVLYVCIYTPLKRRSPLAIPVGALPGATPVLIGWSAAQGTLNLHAWVVFAILFLWQLPHFLSIGWMYRADYERAGLRLIPGGKRAGSTMAWQVVTFASLLILVSVLPAVVGLTHAWWYVVGAIILGLAHLAPAIRLATERSGEAARALLRASVTYLPALLALLAAATRWTGP